MKEDCVVSLFQYEAVDSFGEAVSGTMDEPSSRRVTEILRERGLQISSVKRVGPRRLFLSKQRLSWEDLHQLNEQLLAVAESGLPMSPALRAFAKDARNKSLRSILEKIENDIEEGSSLGEAFTKHAGSFSPMYVSLIRAGERSGNLVGILGLLSTYTGRGIDIKNTLKMALAYPALVLVCTLGVLTFLMTKLVPMFADIFGDFGAGLPAPTRFVVDMSKFIDSHLSLLATVMLTGVCGSVLATRIFSRHAFTSSFFDYGRQRIPFYGRLFRSMSLARFCRSFGLLLQANVPITESLDLAGAASGNEALRKAVRQAALEVNGGERIADALSHTRYFDHSFCWLFSTGEERGDVHQALAGLAESYDRDVAFLDRMMGTMLAPVLIIVVGMLIGFVVFTLYLPIFSLGDAISGG